MKLHKIFLGCAAAMALASCVSEDITKSAGKDSGTLQIGVETQEPLKTRADIYQVTDFPVTIYQEDGITEVESFPTVAEMPTSILLPTGTYVLEAHTPGEMESIMTTPYYKGRELSEILKGGTTESIITCKMANTSITVHYDQDFLNLFTSWTITFDDGTDNALSIKNTDGTEPATLYWDLGEGVDQLTINFLGKTAEGTVSAPMTITKSQATETYGGETTKFAGGDAIVVNFTPELASTGFLTVGITASIFGLNAEEVEATVEIADDATFTPDDGSGDEPGGDEPGGDEPGGDDPEGAPYFVCASLATGDQLTCNAIYYSEEDEYEYSAAGTLPQTEVKIYAPKGLQSVKVTITGGNTGFAGATTAFQNHEIIGSSELGPIFSTVPGAELPYVGQEEYTFPVYAFYGMIALFGPTDSGKAHEFKIDATDQEGNVKTATLKVTVVLGTVTTE
ncbi:MAG: DUF4493 domain-containing protein [Bacteroidaceae bacterium]|nr:DUF4493 domain-containing protein [Bacteroidaceae bacterium]